MKKFTGALSLILTLVMVMTMAMPALATYSDDKIINYVNIIFSQEIAGKTTNDFKSIFPFEAKTADDKVTDKLILTDVGIRDVDDYYWLEQDEEMIEGRRYRFYLYFNSPEGYILDENFDGYVNDSSYDYNIDVSVDDEFYDNACIFFDCIVTAPGKTIQKINAVIDKSKMVGKSASDYKDFFSFSTEHLLYDDNTKVYVYDITEKKLLADNEKMAYGHFYSISINLKAETGYYISKDLSVREDKSYFVNCSIADTQTSVIYSYTTALKDPAKCINRIDITFDSDNIIGKCRNDYLDYFTFSAEHTIYGDPYVCINNYEDEIYHLSPSEKIASDKIYEFGFFLAAEEGYYFGDDVRVYINGKETYNFYYNDEYGHGICIYKNVETLSDDKLIKRVDINLKDDITGKTPEDYKDFFTFSAAHCSYDTDGSEPAVYAVDYNIGDYIDDDATFAEWIKYGLELCLVADEGYCFSNDLEVYVNGKKDDSFIYDTSFYEGSGSDHLRIMLDKAFGSYLIGDMAVSGSAKYNQNVTATINFYGSLPSGATVKIDGAEVEVKDGVVTKNFGRLKNDKSFTVSVYLDGRELSSKTLTISVAHGFFDIISGFFNKLFKGDKYATTIDIRKIV